jgi:hypothetical protein
MLPHAAGAQNGGAGFAAMAAKQIHEVARFDPPEFALTDGRDGPFAFYGAAMNEFDQLRCERSASFGVIARANMVGQVRVGICEREAQRVRALAVSAQPRLAGTIALLRDGASKLDAPMLEKMGWTYSKISAADGAEEHYFPVIAVGHGIGSLPTLVRIAPGARRAIVVQAEVMQLCEKNYGLKDRTALCIDTRRALTDLARRLDARSRD